MRGSLGAVVVAVATLLATSACSGGGSDADPSPDVPQGDAAAVTRDLAQLYAGDHSTPDGLREGRCFATAFLESTDTGDLVEAGVLDDDGDVVDALPTLDADTAEQWVVAQESCTSFLDASTEALRAQSKGAVDADRYRACLDGRLTDDQLHDAQVAALTGDLTTDAVTALSDAQQLCASLSLPDG